MKGRIYAEPASVSVGASTVLLNGLFMYRDEPAGDASLRAFLNDFDRGAVNFDDCTGSYRLRISHPGGRETAFSDNAGNMRWYIREDGHPLSEEKCPPPPVDIPTYSVSL